MFEHLLSPLALGPVTIPNRILSTSHQTTLVHDHLPTAAFVAYHEERARGGAGLISLEATAIHPSGLLTAHTLAGFDPRLADGYRRVAEAVHRHGTKVFVQLFHGGREQISSAPRAPVVGPSAVPSARFRTEPRALRTGEIEELIAGYAASARIAAEGSLDGVELSAAHAYLLASFFTPALNRREDEWADGPRLLLAVIDSVREAAPGLALSVRLSADQAAARVVAPLLAGRVDVLSVTLGDSPSYLGSSLIVPPPPVPENAIAAHLNGFRVGPPLIANARIVEPEAAEALIATGKADAVGMTRALIADPALVAKLRAGRRTDVVRCIGCNGCIAHYHAETGIRCAVNIRTGRELEVAPTVRADRALRVVVVGAGPAGLAAAAEAGAAGHAVVVLERSDRVGGQIALAAASPSHAETARTLAANFEHAFARDGVEVRFGVEVDAETVAALAPDAVIVATGARPYAPPLALDGVRVAHAWDVLASPPGDAPLNVIVADWGGDPSGLAAAEALSLAGHHVTLATATIAVGESVHQYVRSQALGRLYGAGVAIEQHLDLVGAASGVARFRNVFAPQVEREFECDLLVVAAGRVPEDGLAPELASLGVPVAEVGDCLSPRSLEEAILEGTLAARRLASQ